MPQEVNLNFRSEDTGLNLTGTVNFPNAMELTISTISIRGLAEWRHVPANIVHVNERMINNFNLPAKAKNLSKIGMNYIGLKAGTDILLSHTVRSGRTGTEKVQAQLMKFFKAIGASSVKFSVLDVQTEMSNQMSNETDSDDKNNLD
jgi:hypothetical protein